MVKEYKPSAFTHPEYYSGEGFEPPQPTTKKTLVEYLEDRLVENGFSIEHVDGGGKAILAWPRVLSKDEAKFTIAPKGKCFVVRDAVGHLAKKKNRDLMDSMLSSWCDEYRLGAR